MSKIKIMIVDDEVEFLELIKIRIRSWGYEAVGANNGKDAISLMAKEKPDVAIIDYIMPDTDGVALLKEIRKINKDIPTIMFTAHPDVKSIKGAEKLGINFYIPKLSVYTDLQTNLKSAVDMLASKIGKK